MKTTVMQEIRKTVDSFGNKVALKTKIDGEWEEMTWEEYYAQVRTTARAFMALGLEKGKGLSILGNNCPKWFISDLAGIFAGAVPGGIYTTNSPEQCQYISEHSEANIAVVENADQLAKFKQIRDQLPDLKAIVLMNGSDTDENVYSWEELSKLAQTVTEDELEERIKAQDPDDCCTLIYTSGTTGNPKGVMISHDNIIWTAKQVLSMIDAEPEEQIISLCLSLWYRLHKLSLSYMRFLCGDSEKSLKGSHWRFTTIKSKDEFMKISLKIFGANSVVCSGQPSL